MNLFFSVATNINNTKMGLNLLSKSCLTLDSPNMEVRYFNTLQVLIKTKMYVLNQNIKSISISYPCIRTGYKAYVNYISAIILVLMTLDTDFLGFC